MELVYWTRKRTKAPIIRYQYDPTDESARKTAIVCWYNNDNQMGITDRFRGMLSIYQYTKENNLSFAINHVSPYNLADYFYPDTTYCDWRIIPPANGLVLHLLFIGTKTGRGYMYTQDNMLLQRRAISWLGSIKGLSRLELITNASFGMDSFGANFKEIFLPNKSLQSSVLSWKDRLGDYITISCRFLNLLGDSNERVEGTPLLSVEEKKRLVCRCQEEIRSLLSTFPADINLLVTSDSANFLRSLSTINTERVFYLEKEGIHHHIGFIPQKEVQDIESDGYYERGFFDSFLEFLLISQAKAALQVQIGPMYPSSFPRFAAAVGNVPYTLQRIDDEQ